MIWLKGKQKNTDGKSGLYSDYSIDKAVNGSTSFSQHKKVFLNNGLSQVEATVNAAASKLAEWSHKRNIKGFADIAFNALKHCANAWYSAYTALERKRKNSDIIKRYLNRCDSLVKKAGFILSVIREPARIAAAAAVVIVSGAIIVNSASYDVVLGVYADGRLVGYLNSKSPMSLAKNALEADISDLTGDTYTLDCKLDYSFVNVKNPEILDDTDCYRVLYDIASEDLADAYALYVDGKHVASNYSFDALNSLLKEIQSDSDGKKTIKNDIQIVNQPCIKSTIKGAGEIAEMLNVNSDDISAPEEMLNTTRVSAYGADESGEDSALDTGIPRFSDGVTKMVVPRTLSDGTKITVDKEELRHELNLVYVKEETALESIPYNTTYEESDDYYTGTRILKKSGREGVAEIQYEVEYNNDGVLSKTEISRSVVKEPVTEVVVIGTSAAPTTNPSGNLIWPCDAPKGITSEFGARDLFGSYDYHLGIDMPNTAGSDAWAADSGVVTYAGFNGSYGYYVTIEHANGISTLYAHLSKIYVEEGDEVKQGDVIGAIGRTGVATANHLHFEVRVDGKPVNPIGYFPDRK